MAIYTYSTPLKLPLPIIPIFCRSSIIKQILLNGIECPSEALFPINHSLLYSAESAPKPSKSYTSLLDLQDLVYTARTVRYRVGDFYLDLSSLLPQFALAEQLKASSTALGGSLDPDATDTVKDPLHASAAAPRFNLMTITIIFETCNRSLFIEYPSTSTLMSGWLSTMLVVGNTGNSADWLPIPLFSMSVSHNITLQFASLPQEYRPICGGRLCICSRAGSQSLPATQVTCASTGYLFTDLFGSLHKLCFIIARANGFLHMEPFHTPDAKTVKDGTSANRKESQHSFDFLRTEYHKLIDQHRTISIYELVRLSPILQSIFTFPHNAKDGGFIGLNLVCYTLTNMRQYDLSAQAYTLYKAFRLAIDFLSLTPHRGRNFNIAIFFDGCSRTIIGNGIIVIPLMPCNYMAACMSYMRVISEVVAKYIFGVHVPAADYASQPVCTVLQQALMLHIRHALLGAVDTRRFYYEVSIRGASEVSASSPALWHQYLTHDVEERYNPGQFYLHHIKGALNYGLYGTPMDRIDGLLKNVGCTSKGTLNASIKKASIKAPACISHLEAVYNFLDTSFGTSYSVKPSNKNLWLAESDKDRLHFLNSQGSYKSANLKLKKGKKSHASKSHEYYPSDCQIYTTHLKETNPIEVAALTADKSRWFNHNTLYNVDFLLNLYRSTAATAFTQMGALTNKHVEDLAQTTIHHSKHAVSLEPDNFSLGNSFSSPTMPRKMGMQLSTALKVDQSFEADDVVTDFGVDIDSQSAASSSVFAGGKQSGTFRSVDTQAAYTLYGTQKSGILKGSQYSANMSDGVDGDSALLMSLKRPMDACIQSLANSLCLDMESLSLMYFYINEPFFPIAYAVPEDKIRTRAEIIGMTIKNNLTTQGFRSFLQSFLDIGYVQINLFFKFLDEVCSNKSYFTGGTWLKTVASDAPDISPEKDAGVDFPDPNLSLLPDTGEYSLNITVLKGAAGAGEGFSAEQYKLGHETLHASFSLDASLREASFDPRADIEGVYASMSPTARLGDGYNKLEQSQSDTQAASSPHPFTFLIHKLGIMPNYISIAYSCQQDSTNNQFTDQFDIILLNMTTGLTDCLKDTYTKIGLPLINRGESAAGCRRLLFFPNIEGPHEFSKSYDFTTFRGTMASDANLAVHEITDMQHAERHDSRSFTVIKGASSNLYASIHMLQQPGRMGSGGSGTLSFNLLTRIGSEFLENIKAETFIEKSFYDTIKTKKFAHVIIDPYNQLPFAYKHHYAEKNDKDNNNCYRSIAKVDCERDIAVQLESLNSLSYNCNNDVIPLLLGILYSEAIAPALQETAFKILIYKITRDNFYEAVNKEMSRLEMNSKVKEQKQWILLLNIYFFGHRRLLNAFPILPDGYNGLTAHRYDHECIMKLDVGSLVAYALLCGYVSMSKATDLLSLLNKDSDTASSSHALTIAVLQALTWQIIRKVIVINTEVYMVLLIFINFLISNATMISVRRMAICSLTLIVSTAWENPGVVTALIDLFNEKGLISEKTRLLISCLFGGSCCDQDLHAIRPSLPDTKDRPRCSCNCCNCALINSDKSLGPFIIIRVIFVHILLDIIDLYLENNRNSSESSMDAAHLHYSPAVAGMFISREVVDECFHCLDLLGANNYMTSSDSTAYIVQPLSSRFVAALYRGTVYSQTHSMDPCNRYAMSNAEALVFMMAYVTHLFTLPLNESKQVEWDVLRGCPVCLVNGGCRCVRVSWPAVRSPDSKSAPQNYVTVRCLTSDFFWTYEQSSSSYASLEEYFDKHYVAQDPITAAVFENGKLVNAHFNPKKRYDAVLFRRADRADREDNSTNPEPRASSCYPEFMLPCLYNPTTRINYPGYLFRQCLFDAAGCMIGQSVASRLIDMLLYPAGPQVQQKEGAGDACTPTALELFKRAAGFGEDMPLLILNAISTLHGVNLLRTLPPSQFDSEAEIEALAEHQRTASFKDALLTVTHSHSEYVNVMTTFCEENVTLKAGMNDNVCKMEHNMGYLIHARYESSNDQVRGTVLRFAGFVIGYMPN